MFDQAPTNDEDCRVGSCRNVMVAETTAWQWGSSEKTTSSCHSQGKGNDEESGEIIFCFRQLLKKKDVWKSLAEEEELHSSTLTEALDPIALHFVVLLASLLC